MTVSNPASFSSIKAEFGGSNNFKDYYRGGPYVAIGASSAISTTAAGLAMSQFNGVTKPSAFTPVQRTYTSGSSITETAPTGASNVIVAIWGAGGGGSRGTGTVAQGNMESGSGGGSGGYVQTSTAISGGQTLVYSVGVGGAGGSGVGAAAGTNSTVSSGSKAITSMTSGGGGPGTGGLSGTGGAGGSASGGTVANTVGDSGGDWSFGDGGNPVVGWNSNSAGRGGNASNNSGTNGNPGAAGQVIFYYT